jgi:Cu/Ag efflux pump CusA
MLQWVVSSALKYRRPVLAVGVVVVAAALWELGHAKVDALPEFTPPTVDVQTEALGLSAEEVEQLVTVPLEQNFLNGIPFLDTISSRSVPGLSSVTLVFEPHTSLFTARQLVQERLSLTTELPNVSKPPEMLQAESSASRLMMIGLSSQRLSPVDLSLLAKYVVRPRLLGVPGVADVAIWGQRDLQLQVQVDPRHLQALGVSLDQVVTTAGNALFVSPLTFLEASTPGTGGFIDTANQRLAVQHLLPIKTAQDLSRVAVVNTSGLRLGDVATVVQANQALIGDTSIPRGSALLLVVEKLPRANTIDVTNRVTQMLKTLRPGLGDVNVDTSVYRPATFIETAIGNLRHAVVIAALLVVVALVLLFFDWGAAVIALVTVPASLITASYVLYLRHTTFYATVVAGLLLGVAIVVHDAVVVTEAIRRRPDASTAGAPAAAKPIGSPLAETVVGIGRPLTYATIIAIVGLAPLLFLAGLPSKPFLPPIAASYALAVGASLLTAVTLTPALAGLLLPSQGLESGQTTTRLAHWIRQPYQALLARAIHTPAPVGLLVGALAVAGLVSVSQLVASLRPTFRETELVVQWDGPPGTSLTEMDRVLGRAQAELRSVHGVHDVGVQVGRAVSGDQVVAVDSGQLWVELDRDADRGATVAAVERVVSGYPGFRRQVFTYFNDRVKAAGPAMAAPVIVRVYGQDFSVLHAKADEIRQLLTGVNGVVAPQVESQTQAPTIAVGVDLGAAQAHGIKPGDVRRAATTLVSGLDVGSLYEDQRVFQVAVVGMPSVRQNLTAVQDLVIDTPEGGHVRLGDVARVQIAPSLNLIKHQDVSRYLDVSAEVRGRNVNSVLADVHRRLNRVSLPLQYIAKVLNGHSAQSAANRRIAGAVALSAVIIFLLLQAAFDSWLLAAIAFLAVPLSLVGGAIALWASGSVISLGATVGFFAVGALAVRASILLLTAFRDAERAEPELPRADIIQHVASEQIGPTLGAAVVAALAFLPFVTIGSVPGTEIVGAMAGVILGGLVSLSLVNLFALPVAYLWCAGRKRARPGQRGADTSVVEELAEVPASVGPTPHGPLQPRRGRPGEAPV